MCKATPLIHTEEHDAVERGPAAQWPSHPNKRTPQCMCKNETIDLRRIHQVSILVHQVIGAHVAGQHRRAIGLQGKAHTLFAVGSFTHISHRVECVCQGVAGCNKTPRWRSDRRWGCCARLLPGPKNRTACSSIYIPMDHQPLPGTFETVNYMPTANNRTTL